MNVKSMVPILNTPRLTLRDMRLADAESYYTLHIEPEAVRYYDWVPANLEAAVKSIEDIIADYAQGQYIHWAVEARETGELIGDLGIFIRDGKGEVNFFLGSDHWGKGFMGEALGRILTWGFEQGLYRIQAMTEPGNEGANRLLAALGFSLEGVLRRYAFNAVRQEYTDVMMWSLLKEEHMSST